MSLVILVKPQGDPENNNWQNIWFNNQILALPTHQTVFRIAQGHQQMIEWVYFHVTGVQKVMGRAKVKSTCEIDGKFWVEFCDWQNLSIKTRVAQSWYEYDFNEASLVFNESRLTYETLEHSSFGEGVVFLRQNGQLGVYFSKHGPKKIDHHRRAG